MLKHIIKKSVLLFVMCFFAGFNAKAQSVEKIAQQKTVIDTLKIDAEAVDSLKIYENYSYKLFKRKAHASYYHNKFNGKRTASGVRFSNSKYTAAHRKFPFGTKLKITNETNGKFVIVEVNDRGPFSRGREIDLSRRAFMEIASNKNSGSVSVTIEVIKEIK